MNNRAEPQLFANDLVVGQTFVGEPRIVEDEQFGLFACLTGDDHPIHYDDDFAAKTRFGKRLAHGLLLMSMTALGPLRCRGSCKTQWSP
jgi:3-hydroxybutyryl-CoA dehydratase